MQYYYNVQRPDTKLELHKKEPTKLELQKNELTKLELHKLEPIKKRTLLQIWSIMAQIKQLPSFLVSLCDIKKDFSANLTAATISASSNESIMLHSRRIRRGQIVQSYYIN